MEKETFCLSVASKESFCTILVVEDDIPAPGGVNGSEEDDFLL